MKLQLRRDIRAHGMRLARPAVATRAVAATAAALAFGVAATGCGGNGSGQGASKGEIVITCTACQDSPTDSFLHFNYEATTRFNAKFAGRYHVKIVRNQFAGPSPERLQYYQRLSLANQLPDVFLVERYEGLKLNSTGKLLNFGPLLDGDPKWKRSFHDGAFDGLTTDGKIWGVPEQRDPIGIFYNKQLLAAAGVTQFPKTWADMAGACQKVKAIGKTCLALDGDWATMLMWSNLIGTMPGGAAFLNGKIADGDFASNPDVVKATETLKSWHTSGYVNKDAFTGDFQNAQTPYLAGDAAFVPNGPWMVPGAIDSKDTVKGLYKNTGYAPAPGWGNQRGLIVVSGNGAWVSGTTDKRKQQAVVAFMKFLTSRPEEVDQIRITGSYPPIKVELTSAETAKLDRLTAGLVKQSAHVPLLFPQAYFRAPAGLSDAFRNLWPAYVKGQMDTNTFLKRLGSEATSTTG